MNYEFDTDFIFTNYCDRGCPYCDNAYLKLWKYDIPIDLNETEYILSKLQILMPYSKYISLSGGEPGFISRPVLHLFKKYILDKCTTQKKMLYTYGLFLKKYPKYAFKNFDLIVYHVSPDLDNYELDYYNSRKVIYHVVLHKHNLHLVEPFLEKYQNIASRIRFGVFNSDISDLDEKFSVTSKEIQNILPVINRFGSKLIYTENVVLDEKVKRLLRKYCYYFKTNIVVDIPKRQLLRCCWLRKQQVLPLNKLSKESINNFINGPYSAKLCEHCHHFPDLRHVSLEKVIRSLNSINKLK